MILYLIRSFLNFNFRFQYQLSILCIFLLTSFHLAEVSLVAFSWLYTLECAVVQKHHEMYFIHIFSTHFAIKICFICTILKRKQSMEQQPHRTVYKKTDEFYIEWQRLATTSNEWCNECQRMATSGTTNVNEWYNEWQRMTTSGTTHENEWKRIRTSKREWFWFQNETMYELYNYNIFSNIDYL